MKTGQARSANQAKESAMTNHHFKGFTTASPSVQQSLDRMVNPP
jgi:hypothetical protein